MADDPYAAVATLSKSDPYADVAVSTKNSEPSYGKYAGNAPALSFTSQDLLVDALRNGRIPEGSSVTFQDRNFVVKDGNLVDTAPAPVEARPKYGAPGETGFLGPLVRAGLVELPAAAAGTAAMGQAMNVMAPLRDSPFMPARVAGTMGPLAYGALAAMTASKATRSVLPAPVQEQLAQDVEQNPVATTIGSTAAQLPFFTPGGLERSVGEFLRARAPAAFIGGGMAAEQEMATGETPTLKGVGLAALTGAVLNKPTRLGEAALAVGSKNPITSKLGNASRKDTIVEGSQAANEIALAEPASPTLAPPPPAYGVQTPQGTIAELSQAIAKNQANLPEPSAGAPGANAGEGLGYMGDTIPELRNVLDETYNLAPDRRLINREKIQKIAEKAYVKGAEKTANEFAKQQVEEKAYEEGVKAAKDAQTKLDEQKSAKEAEANATKIAKEEFNPDVYAAVAEPVSKPIEAPVEATPRVEPEKPVNQTEEALNRAAMDRLSNMTDEERASLPKREFINDELQSRYEEQQSKKAYLKELLDTGEITKKEYNEQVKGISGGKIKSKSGSVINPSEAVNAISERAGAALDKVNEPLLERMAQTDVENINPLAKRLSVFDQFVGRKPEEQDVTPNVEFPKPGEGKSPSAETAKINKQVQAVNKKIEAQKPPTREEIWAQVQKDAKENGNPTPPEHVAKEIESAPDQYKPFLTDMAARFPLLEKYLPGFKESSSVIGGISKFAKEKLGLLDENVREHSPRAFGALHEKIYNQNRVRLDLTTRADALGKAERKYLTPEEFKEMEAAKLSGDEAKVYELLAKNDHGGEIAKALEAHQQVMQELGQAQRAAGREVPEGFYFHRRLVDREGLLKHLGAEGESTYRDALKAAAREKGVEVSELSLDDKDTVLNNLVAGSIRNAGKPGYLKPRVIETITKDMLKFYEPTDVATHDYIMSTTRDTSNREFFGKTGEGEKPEWMDSQTPIGRILREEYQSGRLTDKGFKQVTGALNDYFQNSTKYDKDMASLANKVRKIQTGLYLADVSAVLPQFADILVSAYKYGPKATTAFFDRKVGLQDINVHEAMNQDISDLRRSSQAPEGSLLNPATDVKKVIHYAGKSYGFALKKFLGWADSINKGGMNAAAHKWVSDVVNNPDSRAFEQLNKKYSEMFPEKWPDMLKSLKSEDFRNGKLDENGKLFLFNELMSLQPLDPAGRAQGYNQAGPWGKVLYTLRGYALTQLNLIRKDIYNNLKSGEKDKTLQGLGNLALYGALVGAGQQAFSYARDVALNRKDDPTEYAVTGFLQLAMIPRFAVKTAEREGPAMAAVQTAIPGLSAAKDIWHDSQLVNKWLQGQKDKNGRPTVDGVGDLLQNSQMVQYAPGFGREAYWWLGKGAKNQEKDATLKAQGKSRPSTADSILNMIAPNDLKTERK